MIDYVEKAMWEGDYNWSYQEYSLEAGPNEIIWTKEGNIWNNSDYNHYYLSLDNILIVYTE
jgi:hypothetical protein